MAKILKHMDLYKHKMQNSMSIPEYGCHRVVTLESRLEPYIAMRNKYVYLSVYNFILT